MCLVLLQLDMLRLVDFHGSLSFSEEKGKREEEWMGKTRDGAGNIQRKTQKKTTTRYTVNLKHERKM